MTRDFSPDSSNLLLKPFRVSGYFFAHFCGPFKTNTHRHKPPVSRGPLIFKSVTGPLENFLHICNICYIDPALYPAQNVQGHVGSVSDPAIFNLNKQTAFRAGLPNVTALDAAGKDNPGIPADNFLIMNMP